MTGSANKEIMRSICLQLLLRKHHCDNQMWEETRVVGVGRRDEKNEAVRMCPEISTIFLKCQQAA